jgi:hypothetical protein
MPLRFYAYYTAVDSYPILRLIDRVPQIAYDDAVHPHQAMHYGIRRTPARACARLD